MLDAAERLLIDEGVEALRTGRIADEAGVSVGSLYQYFPDVGAIVDALARRYLGEFEALMDELAERALSEDWGDLVGGLIDGFAARYRSEPGYRALWSGRHLSDELLAADRTNKRTLAEGVRRVLSAAGSPATARRWSGHASRPCSPPTPCSRRPSAIARRATRRCSQRRR